MLVQRRRSLTRTTLCLSVIVFVNGCLGPSNEPQQQTKDDAVRIRTVAQAGVLPNFSFYNTGVDGGLYSILESLGGGAAVLDLERDGNPDLYFAGGGGISKDGVVSAGNTILRHRGDSYSVVSEKVIPISRQHYTHGVSVSDFDNDGFDDIVVSGYGGLTMLHNNGDGTLEDVTEGSSLNDSEWSTSVACADFDGDGCSDFYVCHYVDWSLSNNPECRSATGARDVCPPRSFKPQNDRIFFNSANGRFQASDTESVGLIPGGKGLGAIAADLDADGDADIYVANDTTANFLYQNHVGRKFEEIGQASGAAFDNNANANGSMGIAATDADGDGMVDVFVANYEDEVFAVYRNLNALSFIHSSDRFGLSSLGNLFVGFGCVASDLDLDGDEEVIVANGHVIHSPRNASVKQEPLLLENLQGSFAALRNSDNEVFQHPQMGRGLVKFDWNHDGLQDLLFCNSDAPPVFVENASDTSGSAIAFALIGLASARKCVGASVVVHLADGRQLVRLVTGGGSYLSHSEDVVHFGIPDSVGITYVAIRWPSGKETSMRPCDFCDYLDGGDPITVLEPIDGREAARNYVCPR